MCALVWVYSFMHKLCVSACDIMPTSLFICMHERAYLKARARWLFESKCPRRAFQQQIETAKCYFLSVGHQSEAQRRELRKTSSSHCVITMW